MVPKMPRRPLIVNGLQFAGGAVALQIAIQVVCLLVGMGDVPTTLLVLAIMCPVAAVTGFAMGCWCYWMGWQSVMDLYKR